MRLRSTLGRLPFQLLVLAAFVLMLAPVVTVMTISVFSDEIISFPPSGLTLDWYVNAWQRQEFARAFIISLQVG